MKSYVTTIVGGLIGLALVVAGLWAVFAGTGEIQWEIVAAGAGIAGVGFFARDNGKTSAQVGAKGWMLLAILPLFIGGCATGSSLAGGEVETRNLGHSAVVMDADSINAVGLDQPTAIWSDSDQDAITTPFATTALAITLPGHVRLHLASPKDGDITSVGLTFGPEGQIASVDVSGIHYSASDPVLARAETVTLFVDYAKALSADEREKFVALIDGVSGVLGEALKAAFLP